MDVESLRNYCLLKSGVEECLPFGPDVLVYKVGGKVFLLLPLNAVPLQFNVKCHPDTITELRERYNCVLPGYHMNKKHWNTIVVDGTVAHRLLLQWIDDSYTLIYNSLPKKIQQQLLIK